MRRPAVSTFISCKRRRATRRAIFHSTSSHTLSVRSFDPDTRRPHGSATTQLTCARRGVDEQSTCGLTGRQRRASSVCPRSVQRHRPLETSHTLSGWSPAPRTYAPVIGAEGPDPDTTLPFDMTATHLTCARRGVDEQSTARFDWTPATHGAHVSAQRPEALTARDVPHLERFVARPGHDAAVRQGGNAVDLRRSRRRPAIDRAV